MRKFGYVLVSMLPALIGCALQMISAMVFMFVDAFQGVNIQNVATDLAYLADLNMRALNGYAAAGVLIFGLWYIFGTKQTRYTPIKPLFTVTSVMGLIMLAVSAQLLVSGVLNLYEMLLPGSLDQYNEMLEMAGIGQFHLLSMLCTVLLAPILEECVFRGISIHFLRKASFNFYVVNFLQALWFGIYHLNLIQGIYAFFIGLLLGFLYYKYGSLWIAIIVHMLINLCGTLLGTFGGVLVSSMQMLYVTIGVGAVLFLVAMIMICKNTPRIDTQGYDY